MNLHKHITIRKGYRIFMNKSFFIVLFLFFLIPTVQSANITWDNPVMLSGTTGGKDILNFGAYSIKQPSTGEYRWYLFYHAETDNSWFATSIYDKNLETLLDGWDSLEYTRGDCNVWNATHFICLGHNFDVVEYDRSFVYDLNDLTWNSLFTETPVTAYDFYSVSAYPNMEFGVSNAYTYYPDFPEHTNTGSLYVPSGWDANKRELDTFADSEHSNRYFVMLESSPTGHYSPVALIYDSTTLTSAHYINSQNLKDPDDVSAKINTSFPQLQRSGNVYYLSYLMGSMEKYFSVDGSNRPQNVRIQAFDYRIDAPAHPFELIWSDNVSIPNVNTTFNYTQSPFLARDNENNKWVLFYAVINTSDDSNLGFYYMEENVTCTCGDWTNTTCYGVYRKQERYCNPSGCDDEVNYIPDDYCNKTSGLEDIHQYQEIKRICGSWSCTSGWLDPTDSPNARCDILFNTSENMSSIETNATVNMEVQKHSLFNVGIGDQSYHLFYCNPITSCVEGQYTCVGHTNVTDTLINNDYYSGEQIHVGFTASEISNCEIERNLMFDSGWDQYRIKGTLLVCYNLKCGRQRQCIKLGLITYSIQELPDCTLNMSDKIECISGYCENGVCVESTEVGDIAGQISSPSGNPFTWILSEFRNNMPDVVIYGFAIFTSIGVSVYTESQVGSKSNNYIGMIALLSIIIFFSVIGFLPAWMGIIISVAIVLLLSKSLWEKK